jgi:hypothetical protein
MRYIVLTLLVLVCLRGLFAQETDTTKAGTADSLSRLTRASVTPKDTVKEDIGFQMAKSPWGAVLRSAIIPGWGQLYSKSYWEIPLILGIGGYFVYEWIDNNRLYQDYRDQYDKSFTSTNPYGNQQLKYIREFYRDQRDAFAWYLGLLYLLNLVDAFVDAHLYDFDVSEGLSIRLSPFPQVGQIGQAKSVTIQFRF